MSNSATWYGVVEGFYGRPWTAEERTELFSWMTSCATMSTYMYAPKDDLLHRGRWRELYSNEQAKALKAVIDLATANHMRFVYSIAPGLDMAYVCEKDRALLLAKINQIIALGCCEFAILFDDIPEELPEDDAKVFRSFAHAQGDVSNFLWDHLKTNNDDATLLFCPTTYCGRMAVPDVPNDAYLNELGTELNPEIAFIWTGPDVISETISVESIRELAVVIKRKPVIWDNLHANDYDNRRYFVGPYTGRPLELKNEVQGILTNPNCQFQLNYIPIMSLGMYLAAEDAWDERANYLELLKEFQSRHGFTHPDPNVTDITLLSDLFYLPHSLGETGQKMMDTIDFLFKTDIADWGDRLEWFQECMKNLGLLMAEINNVGNREMLYALYGPVWMLREEIHLINKVLEWKAAGSKGDCTSVFHLPKTYRGNLIDRLSPYFYLDENGVFQITG